MNPFIIDPQNGVTAYGGVKAGRSRADLGCETFRSERGTGACGEELAAGPHGCNLERVAKPTPSAPGDLAGATAKRGRRARRDEKSRGARFVAGAGRGDARGMDGGDRLAGSFIDPRSGEAKARGGPREGNYGRSGQRVVCIDDWRARALSRSSAGPRNNASRGDRDATSAAAGSAPTTPVAASGGVIGRWLAPLLYRYRNVISIQAASGRRYPGTIEISVPAARS